MKTKLSALVFGLVCMFSAGAQSYGPIPFSIPLTADGRCAAKSQVLSVSIPEDLLLKYAGDYLPESMDKQLVPMALVFVRGYLYRRLEGDIDRLLLPTSGNTFTYADNSGRTLEVLMNAEGEVTGVILQRWDGEFFLEREK